MANDQTDVATQGSEAPMRIISRLRLAAASILLLLVAVAFAACGGGGPTTTDPLSQAILDEDWEQVVALLDSAEATDLTPAANKYLEGHALLAQNRNDEATCLFWATSDGDLEQWDLWTDEFQQDHSGDAIAFYLKGDAAARLERWVEAVELFSEGLDHDPDSALLLNARGVAYAAQGDRTMATTDFKAAIEANPSFADAHASLGTQYVLARESPENAIAAFDRALGLSSNFPLAYSGRASAQAELREWEDAERDFQAAAAEEPCAADVISANIGHKLELLSCLANDEAGTVLSAVAIPVGLAMAATGVFLQPSITLQFQPGQFAVSNVGLNLNFANILTIGGAAIVGAGALAAGGVDTALCNAIPPVTIYGLAYPT